MESDRQTHSTLPMVTVSSSSAIIVLLPQSQCHL